MLDCLQSSRGIRNETRCDIVKSFTGFIEQLKMDVSPLKAVVVIESLSVYQSDVALAVLGDDLLLCTGFDLVG